LPILKILIFRTVQLLEKEKRYTNRYINRFSDIFIDEFQDINAGQYRLIQTVWPVKPPTSVSSEIRIRPYTDSGVLRPAVLNGSWMIFRKAGPFFLRKNYRSTQTILELSVQVIQKNPDLLETGGRRVVYSGRSGDRTIPIMTMATEKAEAVVIGKTIEKMVGGTGFFFIGIPVRWTALSTRSPFSFQTLPYCSGTRNQSEK
jgi:DNA helicase-2/ATP-dependent DNA helicase PcrA